ncbi:MAG: hypothetical protein J2P15_07865 [Micromonosporaceae bacterium]|nr:hypothetical protein [Micromonosporaceae bacterium]
MAELIGELDGGQEQALRSHMRGWLQRALSTAAPDWNAVETAIANCTSRAGAGGWREVVYVPSPLSLARAMCLLVDPSVDPSSVGGRDSLAGRIRRDYQEQFERELARVYDRQVRERVRAEVFAALGAPFRDGEQVADAVAEALSGGPLSGDPDGVQQAAWSVVQHFAYQPMPWEQEVDYGVPTSRYRTRLPLPNGRQRDAGRQEWRWWLGGLWEAAWSAYATFFAGYGPAGISRLAWVEEFCTAQSADFWLPYHDFTLISQRPVVLGTDNDQLHCADGPAVAWPDGWELYFWHGTRVPGWVIHAPTVKAINVEPNVEIRRCAIESMGWETYLDQARLSLVDTSDDPGNPGCQLLLYDVPEHVWGEPVRVLLATNGSPERDGTRRRYALPVPADMDTALHAAAWTYGLTSDRYAALVRRT